MRVFIVWEMIETNSRIELYATQNPDGTYQVSVTGKYNYTYTQRHQTHECESETTIVIPRADIRLDVYKDENTESPDMHIILKMPEDDHRI